MTTKYEKYKQLVMDYQDPEMKESCASKAGYTYCGYLPMQCPMCARSRLCLYMDQDVAGGSYLVICDKCYSDNWQFVEYRTNEWAEYTGAQKAGHEGDTYKPPVQISPAKQEELEGVSELNRPKN